MKEVAYSGWLYLIVVWTTLRGDLAGRLPPVRNLHQEMGAARLLSSSAISCRTSPRVDSWPAISQLPRPLTTTPVTMDQISALRKEKIFCISYQITIQYSNCLSSEIRLVIVPTLLFSLLPIQPTSLIIPDITITVLTSLFSC